MVKWNDDDPIVQVIENDAIVKAVAALADVTGVGRERALEMMVVELSRHNLILTSKVSNALWTVPLVMSIKDTDV